MIDGTPLTRPIPLPHHDGLTDKMAFPEIEGASLPQNGRSLFAVKKHKAKSPVMTRGQWRF
jgi:hypothetical protein